MAFRTATAFAAGVMVGWTGRSMFSSSREALVKAVVAGHEVAGRVRRFAAERAEWLEDVFAEGKARYDERRPETPIAHDEAPTVIDLRAARERAA